MEKALIAPFVAYLVGTLIVSGFGEEWYPIGYSIVAFGTAILFAVLARQALNAPIDDASSANEAASTEPRLFRVHASVLPGILAGVVGIVLWIFLCDLGLEQAITAYLPRFLRPGERVGYNPFEALDSPSAVWAFIAVRLFGIAVVVPVAEELFWRGFLLRWLVDPEWKRVPLGFFTWSSCMIVVAMFTSAHQEWFAAAVYCLLINGLLYWKRDLWQCIVAHSVSNALLAAYVLKTGTWHLW